jgi:hypothetical protein
MSQLLASAIHGKHPVDAGLVGIAATLPGSALQFGPMDGPHRIPTLRTRVARMNRDA